MVVAFAILHLLLFTDLVNSEPFCLEHQECWPHQTKFQKKLKKISSDDNLRIPFADAVKRYLKEISTPENYACSAAPKSMEKASIEVPRCHCQKETLSAEPLKQSMCSSFSAHRGDQQKVIAVSYYSYDADLDKRRLYFPGIWANLFLAKKYYPGWTVRLYHDLDDSDPKSKLLCHLACTEPDFDLCHAQDIPALGDVRKMTPMMWRFLPIIDPQVSYFMSRDLDSRINQREADAVQEWLLSKKSFHIMRDHPRHTNQMLGGLWGVKITEKERSMALASFYKGATEIALWLGKFAYGVDQHFLELYIWPWAKYNAISHDSFHCEKYVDTTAFPTRRPLGNDNYAGAVVTQEPMLTEESCPAPCRRHQDWVLC